MQYIYPGREHHVRVRSSFFDISDMRALVCCNWPYTTSVRDIHWERLPPSLPSLHASTYISEECSLHAQLGSATLRLISFSGNATCNAEQNKVLCTFKSCGSRAFRRIITCLMGASLLASPVCCAISYGSGLILMKSDWSDRHLRSARRLSTPSHPAAP